MVERGHSQVVAWAGSVIMSMYGYFGAHRFYYCEPRPDYMVMGWQAMKPY